LFNVERHALHTLQHLTVYSLMKIVNRWLVKLCNSSSETHFRATEHHLPNGITQYHTVLPATQHRSTCPASEWH